MFGRVTYSIASGDVDGVFMIDSGRLLVVGDVDRENITGYSFTIAAEDGGNPPRRATLDITVSLEDVNDNSPVFGQSSYEGVVEENQVVGNILRVSSQLLPHV